MNSRDVVILLAVAVPECADAAYPEIPCAEEDAEKLYSALASAAGDYFSHEHSAVVVAPSANEFRALIELKSLEADVDGTLVVYFSGHGLKEDGDLSLLLRDSDVSRRGRVRGSELAAAARFSPTMFILDCCDAGAALPITRYTAEHLPPQTAVIAATPAGLSAQFEETGSTFTALLCRAFGRIAETGDSLTLQTLQRHLAECSDPSADQTYEFAGPEGGSTKVLRVEPAHLHIAHSEFGHDFARKAQNSPTGAREMLWYSLGAMPVHYRLAAIERWVDTPSERAEPSWLVRRAIGSTLASLPTESTRRQAAIAKLLDGPDWMSKAVGVIGSRSDLTDLDLLDRLRNILADPHEPADLTWLAFLYLTDADALTIDDVLPTFLMNSLWGLIEIWERMIRNTPEAADLEGGLLDHCCDRDEVQLGLQRHIELTRLPAPPSDPRTLDEYVYTRPQRGPIGHPAAKWMLSNLYGSWRSQLDSSLERLLNNLSSDDALNQLGAAHSLPGVAHRMGVVEHFKFLPVTPPQEEALAWAFTDEHPWVRRTAVECLPVSTQLDSSFFAVERKHLPGALDLLLVAHEGSVLPSDATTAITPPLTQLEDAAVANSMQQH